MAVDEKLIASLARKARLDRVVRVVPFAAPAAGAEFVVTVPGGSVWRPFMVTAQLISSAVVATRAPSLKIDDGSTVVGTFPMPSGQAASLTVVYTWADVGSTGGSAAAFGAVSGGLPDLALEAGWRLRSSTALIDVADQWSNVVVYVEEVLSQPQGVHEYRDALQEAFLLYTSLSTEALA